MAFLTNLPSQGLFENYQPLSQYYKIEKYVPSTDNKKGLVYNAINDHPLVKIKFTTLTKNENKRSIINLQNSDNNIGVKRVRELNTASPMIISETINQNTNVNNLSKQNKNQKSNNSSHLKAHFESLNLNYEKIEKMTKQKLSETLKKCNLPTTGTKEQQIERLKQYFRKNK
eukprot:TRINITY_DN1536_c1_g1_i1.p1 TRINITY_DN1536_c1_g1~~TRINITY_DN1536_c1_g1_i1.p1  ORF type:complete len:172 (-),score=59.42 TRINITY_DN1536_c1_g1_i1:48-563(-)